MENKFLKVSKRLGAVVLGATLLCVNMQGATLKEIEAKKKAEAKAQKEAQQTLKGNQVVIVYDKNVIAELANDIPDDKKKMLKQAIYYANIAKGEYSKAEWGHMIDSYGCDWFLIQYIIEPYKDIEWTKHDREKLLNGKLNMGYFGGKYGFVDSCILETTYMTAGSYINTHSKKYYGNFPGFSQTNLNNKKALAKWLNDVFYPYIDKLEISDHNAESNYIIVKDKLKKIKEAMVIQ